MKNHIIIVALIFVSCVGKEQTPLKTISFTNPTIVEDFSADWIQIDQYFSLNIPDSITIGVVKQLEWSDSFLYILEDGINASVMVFDRDGQFVNRLLKMGTGPGEYVAIDFFMIDSEKLSIYDRSQKKLIHYKLDDYSDFQDFSVQDYLLGGTYLPDKDGYFLVSDSELESNSYKGYGFTTTDFSSIMFSPQPAGYIEAFLPQSISQSENGYFITQPFKEKIFEIAPDSLILEAQIDFGNKRVPESVAVLNDAEEFYELLSTGSYYFAAHNVLMSSNSTSFNFFNETIETLNFGLVQGEEAHRFAIDSDLKELFLKPIAVREDLFHTVLLPGEYDEEVMELLNLTEVDYEKPILVSYTVGQ